MHCDIPRALFFSVERPPITTTGYDSLGRTPLSDEFILVLAKYRAAVTGPT